MSSTAATERAGYRALWANRGFRNLLFAMLTSGLGDWIGLFAILSLTESIIGSGSRATPFALSGVIIARILPALIGGPLAGTYADRWDRKRTMIVCDIGRGCVMAIVPFSQDFIHLFVATFIVEVMAMLFTPAKDAIIPNLIPKQRLVQANQLSLVLTYGTMPLAGMLLAGLTVLARAVSEEGSFLDERPESLAIWVNAVTFFVSAVLVAGIPLTRKRTVPKKPEEERPSGWEELRAGLKFIFSQRIVRALVGGIMGAYFCAGIVFALGPLLVGVVNADEAGWGFLVAAAGTGLLTGLIAAGPLAKRLPKERLFAPGVLTAGFGTIGTALAPRLEMAAFGAFVMGIGGGIAFLIGYTLLQEGSDDAIRGRTFAAFNTGVRVSLFLSLILAPLVAGIVGPEPANSGTYQIGAVRLTMVAGGLIAVVGGLYTGSGLRRAIEARLNLPLNFAALERTGGGIFVAFEGGEGAGKTTQVDLLREHLESRGQEVIVTREPGGTPLGDRLREVLLDPERDGMSPHAEALLYAAARAQHADEIIRPALEKGMIVLCDRYLDSSIAYQGAGRGLGEQPVESLNRWGTRDLLPDLVFVLDVDPAEGLRRAAQRRSVATRADRLEGEGLAFHGPVNEAFKRRAVATPARYVVLDAAKPSEEVQAQVRSAIEGLLARRQEARDALDADAVKAARGSSEPGDRDDPEGTTVE